MKHQLNNPEIFGQPAQHIQKRKTSLFSVYKYGIGTEYAIDLNNKRKSSRDTLSELDKWHGLRDAVKITKLKYV